MLHPSTLMVPYIPSFEKTWGITARNKKFDFYNELKIKIPQFRNNENNNINTIARVYNALPVALFIACGNNKAVDIIGIMHGFIEPGDDPQPLLNTIAHSPVGTTKYKMSMTVNRAQQMQNASLHLDQTNKNIFDTWYKTPTISFDMLQHTAKDAMHSNSPYTFSKPQADFTNYGYLYNYLNVTNDGNNIFLTIDHHSNWHWGKPLAQAYLTMWSKTHSWLKKFVDGKTDYKITNIFRGHQHAGPESYKHFPEMMNHLWKNHGLYKAWTDHAEQKKFTNTIGCWTLAPAPYTAYGVPPKFTKNDEKEKENEDDDDDEKEDEGKNNNDYKGFAYDTWTHVITAEKKEDWQLNVINLYAHDSNKITVKVYDSMGTEKSVDIADISDKHQSEDAAHKERMKKFNEKKKEKLKTYESNIKKAKKANEKLKKELNKISQKNTTN